MDLPLFSLTKAGLSLGKVATKLLIDEPNPTLTSEGPCIYSPDGKYLAAVKPNNSGFIILNAVDGSIYLDVSIDFC